MSYGSRRWNVRGSHFVISQRNNARKCLRFILLISVTRLISGGPVQFGQDVYHVEVPENSSPGPILQLSVSVSSKSEPVRFIVRKGDPGGNLFRIDNETGKLILLRSLDFEKARQHELIVEARSGEAKSDARVVVMVRDANDHEPSFRRQKYETQITEEDDRHLPKKILTVSAEDGDAGEFGRLVYGLQGDGTPSATAHPSFNIDSESGALFVLKPLDRDPPNGREKWVLQVTATDGKSNTSTTITVNVKDVNDNVPYFDEDVVHASIMENSEEGVEVVTMVAHDNDDVNEGSNARLTYSLEKNVIDEKSGRPLFTVDGSTGRVTTSLCCLDREETPQYAIQVVATDGGGMKGTGTVIVNIADENDVPPKFSEREWTFLVEEEFKDNEIVASLSVIDKDENNDFSYRIVPGSGPGWQMFKIDGDSRGHTAYLRTKCLDFENPSHRKGFRFFVQVTDRGKDGWQIKEHIDGAWVNIGLKDINDNAPTFTHARVYFPHPQDSPNPNFAHLTIPEDVSQNTILASFKAHDVDQEGMAAVKFHIAAISHWAHNFAVDDVGIVRLAAPLDRETTVRHEVFVVASDLGNPPLNSTATLMVDLTDVNDNAPFILPPPIHKIPEGVPPRVVGKFYLGDLDDWGLGHGPPFNVRMDPNAPETIKSSVGIEFHPNRGPNGAGEGTVRTKVSLDRERNRQLFVPLFVSDSGRPPMTATRTLTILVEDVNDNAMRPGEKKVFVLRTQTSSSAVPLGRIYVRDLDDWDAAEKTYAWKKVQPLFRLDPKEGSVEMLPGGKEGRYDLHFLVSDDRHQQKNISAKVFVEVHLVSRELLRSSLPLLLDAPPDTLILNDKKTSLLQRFEDLLSRWMEDLLKPSTVDSAETSLFKQNMDDLRNKRRIFHKDFFQDNLIHVVSMIPWGKKQSQTRIYLLAQDLLNLHHLVLFYRESIFAELGIKVLEIGNHVHCKNGKLRVSCEQKCEIFRDKEFWVIDANVTSRVGPKMFDGTDDACGCQDDTARRANRLPGPNSSFQERCYPNPCLNGGRCLPTQDGFKCICPANTEGNFCKILMRSFEGSVFDGGGPATSSRQEKDDGSTVHLEDHSWAWVPAPNLCSEGHFSLELLTNQSEALVLHWGFPSVVKKSKPLRLGRRNKRELSNPSAWERPETEGYKTVWNESVDAAVTNILENSANRVFWKLFGTDGSADFGSKHKHFQTHSPNRVGFPNGTASSEVKNRGQSALRNVSEPFQVGNPSYVSVTSAREVHDLSDVTEDLLSNKSNSNINNKESKVWNKRVKRQLLQRLPKNLPDLLKVELKNGVPVTTLQIQGKKVILSPAGARPINDNNWHRIDIIWRQKTVEVVLDLCLGESAELYENFHHSDQVSSLLPTPGITVPSEARAPLPVPASGSPKKPSQYLFSSLLSSKSTKPLPRPSNNRPRKHSSSSFNQDHFSTYPSSRTTSSHGSNSNPSSSTTSSSFPRKSRFTFPNPPMEESCRAQKYLASPIESFQPSTPINLGGLKSSWKERDDRARSSRSVHRSYSGCIKNFRINGELQDLGFGLIAKNSLPGCPRIDCSDVRRGCGSNGRCVGSPDKEYCTCNPGWKGISCQQRTEPLSFHPHSYVSLVATVPPFPYITTLQMRFRTRELSGTLVQLYGIGGQLHMSVDLKDGHICLVLRWPQANELNLCLNRVFLNDGIWHSVEASRRGIAGILSVDDGDGDFYNSSLELDQRKAIQIDTNEAIWIGGVPQQIRNEDVFIVKRDFRRGCLDDLRLQGKPLPLPPTTNSTKWGNVKFVHEVSEGCSPPSPCSKVSCRSPLTCYDTWRSYHCGCGKGKHLSERNSCDYVDECIWAPCLHGAACLNTNTGYSCSCPEGFTGRHCQMIENEASSFSLSVGAMTAAIAWCFILLLLCAILIHHQHRRSASNKGRGRADGKENEMPSRDQSSPSSNRSLAPNLLELKMIRPPDINGQASWTKNPNIAHVDVLQVEPIQSSEMMTRTTTLTLSESVGNEADCRGSSPRKGRLKSGTSTPSKGAKTDQNGSLAEQNGGPPRLDQNGVTEDLRNYAYEGEGSSPGSLSSCLESCSGSFKFMEGFREVAQLLESCEFQSSSSSPPNEVNESVTLEGNTPIERNKIQVKGMTSSTSDRTTTGSKRSELTPVNEVFLTHVDDNALVTTLSDSKDGNLLPRKDGKKGVFCTSGSSLIPDAPLGFRNS